MSISSQQYADLARDAYKGYTTGVFPKDGALSETIGGVEYLIRAHVDNTKTGYQGTIYQSKDTGELVVSHRGTEFDREAFKDGALADGGMVLNRSNLQANDAIALTQLALNIAKAEKSEGMASGPVTTTGHSLGGTLAQISAHHFDLQGETFNAYGAASLGRRIPEGGHAVINHMMAGDAVSAASPHYGETRIYARQQEIDTLLSKGYDNRTHWSDAIRSVSPVVAMVNPPPSALGAAVAMGGSHSMHHFVGVDGTGKSDRSILADPQARSLAQQQSVQIGEYRQDVRQMRGVLTAVSRGIDGNLKDTIDTLRGPLDPGDPAQSGRKGAALDPAALPPGSRQLLDDSRDHVKSLADKHGLPWDQGMENTVFAVASSAAESGLSRITHLKMEAGHIRFAEHDGLTLKEARIDARQAANMPADESVQKLASAQENTSPPVATIEMSREAPAMSRA
jgi:hypothetical protein